MIQKTFDFLSPNCGIHDVFFSEKAIRQMAKKAQFPLLIWFNFDYAKPVGIIQSLKYDKKRKMLTADCLFREKVEEKLKLGAQIIFASSHKKGSKEIIKRGELLGAGLSENASVIF